MNISNNEAVIGNLVAQTNEDIEDEMKLDSRTQILDQVLKNLVPKFGNTKLTCNPHHIVSKLRT